MAEFHPPEVELAYLWASSEVVPDHFWQKVPKQAELDELHEQADTLRTELEAEGVLGLTGEQIWHSPEHIKERALRFHSMEAHIFHGTRARELDINMREVIGFVLQGLSDRGLPDELMVEFDSVGDIGDGHFELSGVSNVPYAIANHPTTERLGVEFASKAGYIAALLLTPDVVRLVLADESRETPKTPRKRLIGVADQAQQEPADA